MSRRGGRRIGRRVGACFALLALVATVVVTMTQSAGADHEPDHVLAPGEVEVTRLDGSQLHKCQGAMPTPGSENTDKRLIGGSLVPGGNAIFEFTYPFDPTDTSGRQDFVILDCVFVDDEPAQAFELHGVPNDVSPFVFQFTVQIPLDVPIGAEFCNVGKTTAAPSSAQASNRKAGPACFVVGGGLQILKVDPAGLPLTGATFEVTCTPSSDLLPVVIEGVTGPAYTGTTGADNAITIAGPLGTSCVVTETIPPPGYVLAAENTVTVVITELAGPNVTFVNPPAVGNLAITKVSDAPGVFSFSVDCPGTAVTNQTVSITVDGAGTAVTSAPITGIPAGTVCIVTELPAAGFEPRAPQTVTIVVGTTTTVPFTNVRQTGTLVVAKSTVGGTGTFSFTVDCNPGTAFDQTITLTDTETRRIDGVPTGTTCIVTEAATATFASVVTPGDGTVVIGSGDNTVSFTNTLRPPVLTIAKAADVAAVSSGDTIGFTVTVSSTGPTTATGVTLVDPLPSAGGVSWAVSPAYSGPGTCSVTGTAPAQTLACSFGDLAPGAGASVHLSSATTGSTSGALTNTATAQAANHGPVSATASVVVNRPILSLTKTADAASVPAGAAIGFTVAVTNTGPGTAADVTLGDSLPGGTGVSWSISPAFTGPGTCSVTGTPPSQALICSFGAMAPGASAQVHVTSATSTATSGTFTNTATARAANHPAVNATAVTEVTAVPAVVAGTVVTTPSSRPPAAPASAQVLGETLARTGVNGMAMTLLGAFFIAVGMTFRRLGARRPARAATKAGRRR